MRSLGRSSRGDGARWLAARQPKDGACAASSACARACACLRAVDDRECACRGRGNYRSPAFPLHPPGGPSTTVCPAGYAPRRRRAGSCAPGRSAPKSASIKERRPWRLRRRQRPQTDGVWRQAHRNNRGAANNRAPVNRRVLRDRRRHLLSSRCERIDRRRGLLVVVVIYIAMTRAHPARINARRGVSACAMPTTAR